MGNEGNIVMVEPDPELPKRPMLGECDVEIRCPNCNRLLCRIPKGNKVETKCPRCYELSLHYG